MVTVNLELANSQWANISCNILKNKLYTDWVGCFFFWPIPVLEVWLGVKKTHEPLGPGIQMGFGRLPWNRCLFFCSLWHIGLLCFKWFVNAHVKLGETTYISDLCEKNMPSVLVPVCEFRGGMRKAKTDVFYEI